MKRADLRVVSCHLGQGASITASRAGKAMATTMGFTPLEGLMMGSRSGSIDPGVVLYVQRRHNLNAEELENILNHDSGLKGVSGLTSDIRDVIAAATQGHARATLALEMFVRRVRASIGAMVGTLGGVDALIFTAGIGENADALRARMCEGLECMGIVIDAAKNRSAAPDVDVAAARSRARIWVLHTEEERVIARHVKILGVQS